MNKNYRLRIAPSPTGYPHIGTIYQALFNYAYAHKYEGTFIVRIEDTDRARFVEGAEDVIYQALDWFALVEDESTRKGGAYAPYRQSERLEIYKKYAQELIEKGQAYYCFCTKERLDEMRQQQMAEKKPLMYDKHCRFLSPEEVKKQLEANLSHVIRMKVPENKEIITHDGVRGEVRFMSNGIDDQVIMKSDGFPTYHLAVVVDDHEMQISHVVRGEDWIPSLPKQQLLYDFFGWEMPPFYHTVNLRNPDKSKLSKRHGHTNIQWYREEGYLPEAILNYLALLGWSDPEEKEIFSLDEFIKNFELKDMRTAGPIFDLQKLTWMNQQYIQNLSDETLIKKLLAFDPTVEEISSELLNQLMPLVKSRMQTLKDFRLLTSHFFESISLSNDETHKQIAHELKNKLSTIENWNVETILSSFREILQEHKIKMPILYTILTGSPKGLPLPETLVILGKEKTLQRLEQYD